MYNINSFSPSPLLSLHHTGIHFNSIGPLEGLTPGKGATHSSVSTMPPSTPSPALSLPGSQYLIDTGPVGTVAAEVEGLWPQLTAPMGKKREEPLCLLHFENSLSLWLLHIIASVSPDVSLHSPLCVFTLRVGNIL